MLAAGGDIHVVIPCEGYAQTFTTSADHQQFRSLLEAASDQELLPFAAPSEQAFLEAGKRVARLSDHLVAVWDGLPAQGVGGTADIVESAQRIGRRVTVIWPDDVRRP